MNARHHRPYEIAAAKRREDQKQRIISCTRSLFDERGDLSPQIGDIAEAVNINRATIYRHFRGKEELFAAILTDYLAELDGLLRAIDDPTLSPSDRLRLLAGQSYDFGHANPAFVECAQGMLRTPFSELQEEMDGTTLARLGISIASTLSTVVEVLDAGVETGEFDIEDTDLLANVLYSQGLGGLNLARHQSWIFQIASGIPQVDFLRFAKVRRHLVEGAVAMARGTGVRPPRIEAAPQD